MKSLLFASERSFSTLRQVKNHLKSTMMQQSLNNFTVLHVHKERTNDLSEVDVCNDLLQTQKLA